MRGFEMQAVLRVEGMIGVAVTVVCMGEWLGGWMHYKEMDGEIEG
jgi:hypothetical protein